MGKFWSKHLLRATKDLDADGCIWHTPRSSARPSPKYRGSSDAPGGHWDPAAVTEPHLGSRAAHFVVMRSTVPAPHCARVWSSAGGRSHIMRRRQFITLLGGTVVAWPLAVGAQQPGKVYRLGVLADVTPVLSGLFYGLRELGYVEGQNLIIERRSSEGRAERWSELAAELVGLRVDAIVVSTTPAALAAKKTTGTIPIIFPTAFDLVGVGLAKSLPRPGGNVTGFTLLVPEVCAKGLALLQEAVPGLRKVAVIWNGGNAANAIVLKEVEATARLAGLALNSGQVREPKDFEATFAAIMGERPQGLLILADSLFMLHRKQIVDFVLHEHLPAMFQFREFAELGGLMSYGPDVQDMGRRGANYVDKILKGARPADLPIEQPTKFELVINLKTAKALGLTIPQALLATADELIE